jgi:hypothetical protein
MFRDAASSIRPPAAASQSVTRPSSDRARQDPKAGTTLPTPPACSGRRQRSDLGRRGADWEPVSDAAYRPQPDGVRRFKQVRSRERAQLRRDGQQDPGVNCGRLDSPDPLGRDADYDVTAIAEDDAAADHCRIATETTHPQAVRQDDRRRGATHLVGLLEPPAQHRTYRKDVEVSRGNTLDVNSNRLPSIRAGRPSTMHRFAPRQFLRRLRHL